jgi:hypothetical protein
MPQGHAPIASRWNYNEHLFPILRDRCGRCHNEGGVAPMSLLTYEDAYPWAQSIREEVLGMRMPPWLAEDGFGDFKNGHVLAAHEMDMILEWASGGYPRGNRALTPPVPEFDSDWMLGEPAAIIELKEPYAIDAETNETVRYFVLPAGTSEDKWVTAIDFKPGARAVVRGAALFVDTEGTARALDDGIAGVGFSEADRRDFPTSPPLALWIPGQDPISTNGMGFRLPAAADVVLRIHYKKTWITEGEAFSDKSRVGLYFGAGDFAKIESVVFASAAELSGREVAFTHVLDREVTLVALLPEVEIEAEEMQVEAVKPDGSRVPMLWLREPSTGWPTRFWFDSPVTLPGGTRLEVTTRLKPAAKRLTKVSLLGTDTTSPIRFLVDYVEGVATAN